MGLAAREVINQGAVPAGLFYRPVTAWTITPHAATATPSSAARRWPQSAARVHHAARAFFV